MSRKAISEKSSNRTTPKGEERRKQILEACKRILTREGYTRFLFRNIAKEAGLSLSNVQYYYQSKEALVADLVEEIAEGYTIECDACLNTAVGPPVVRFMALTDHLLAMIRDSKTRYFLIQLWALLDSVDRNNENLLNKLYLTDIANIEKCILDINPLISKGARQQRATMIAAMVEGMILMLDDADLELQENEQNIEVEIKKQLLRIAMDP